MVIRPVSEPEKKADNTISTARKENSADKGMSSKSEGVAKQEGYCSETSGYSVYSGLGAAASTPALSKQFLQHEFAAKVGE